MRTNIDIDDKLMKQTIQASGERTKRAAMETAMRAFLQIKKQEKGLRELRGIGQWEGNLEQSRLSRFEDREW